MIVVAVLVALSFVLLRAVRQSHASWLQDRGVQPGYPADQRWRS